MIKVNNVLLDLRVPKVMGILNATPDSFYAESRTSEGALASRILQMVEDGVGIFDIGGYSTRPGAAEVSIQEEIDRVIPVILKARELAPKIPISIDTFRTIVAKEAVSAGAGIINDVSGGDLDSEMFSTVAKLKVPYVLMHMRGNPQTMAGLNTYQNLTLEVIKELQVKFERLKLLGVSDIIIDPGFGFAKDLNQNYELLRNLKQFEIFGCPILVGFSRKRMVREKLNTSTENSLNGTSVLNSSAFLKGAAILRVHDVKEAFEVVKLLRY